MNELTMKAEGVDPEAWTIRTIVWLVGVIALVTAVSDQVTKVMVTTLMEVGGRVEVIPGLFDVILTHNKGAAFGLFSGVQSDVLRFGLLALSTVIALTVLFLVLVREYRYDRLGQGLVGLILGGAIGNLVDRIRLGEVVDFLDFYIAGYHWPAFNLADSAICVGVVFLLFRRSAAAPS